LDGRTGQITLYTVTPSNLRYDRGDGILHRTHQGCKKSARIKLLVNNTNGIKALSIIQTNYITKTIKDEKITKMVKRNADIVFAVAADV
jgi:hypothetical protein